MPATDTTRLGQIEPVNPRFFQAVSQDPLISGSAKVALVDRALEGRLELEKVRSAMVGARQTERLNDLRIEREEFMLREARRKAREDRDAVAQAGNLRGAYEEILADPDLGNDEKHDAIDRMRLLNPGAFTRSRELQEQHDAAKNLLEPKVTAAQQRAIEREERIQTQWEEKLRRDDELRRRKEELGALRGELEAFDKDSGVIRGLKFAEGDLDIGGDKPSDDLKNPNEKQTIISYIRNWSDGSGVEVPPVLESLNARQLQEIAFRIEGVKRSQYARSKSVIGATEASIDFGLPDE